MSGDDGGSNGPDSEGAIDVSLLEKRLEGLRDTQESVQGLSLWCQANKKSSSAVIDTWFKVLKKSPVEKRLTLFYLANDVVQHAKRKGDLVVVNLWICAVQKATPLVRTPSAVSSAIARIFKIWEERNVYSKDFVADLLSLLNNVPAKDKVEKRKPETYTADAAKVQAFQPSFLVNKVKSSRIKSHLGVAFKSKHYFNIESNALKGSINNREHGLDVITEMTKLLSEVQESENKLQSEVDERRKIVEAAEIAIVFYENVRSEAKIVNSAYKNFTTRVEKTLEKVNEKIKAFDEMEGDFSPIPSPPSPQPEEHLQPPPIPSYVQLPSAPRPPSPQMPSMPSISVLGQIAPHPPQIYEPPWQDNYIQFNTQSSGSIYQTPEQQSPFIQSSSNVYQTPDQLPFQLPNFQPQSQPTTENRYPPNSFDLSDVSSIPLPPGGPPPPEPSATLSPVKHNNQQLSDYETIESQNQMHPQMNMNNNNNNINPQQPPPNMSHMNPQFPNMNQPPRFGQYGDFMGNNVIGNNPGRFNPYPPFPPPQNPHESNQQNEHQFGGFRGNGRRPNIRGRGMNRGGPRQRGFSPRNPIGMNRSRPLLDTPMGGQTHMQPNQNFPSQPFNNYETFEGKQLAHDVPGVNGGSASPEEYDYMSDGPPGVMSPPRRGSRGSSGIGNNFRSSFRGRFPRSSPRTRGGNF